MATKTIEVEADTLEEAREQLKSQMHKGLEVLSEDIISDGNPTTVRAAAESIQAAFARAQEEIPNDASIMEKKELAVPEEKTVTVEAFDEPGARAQVESQIGTTIKTLKLVTVGKKRFLGIGKKPNQYEAEVFQQAAVEVTYKKKAKIRAEIGVKLVSPSRISPTDSFAQAIWDLTEGPLGSVEVIEGRGELEITLYLFGLSQLSELQLNIQVARQAGATITNVTDVADKLFLAGLYAIAGRMKLYGKDFAEFGPACHALTTTYVRKIKPIAVSLNRGVKPSSDIISPTFGTISAFVFQSHLKELSPLVQFLNDELSRWSAFKRG